PNSPRIDGGAIGCSITRGGAKPSFQAEPPSTEAGLRVSVAISLPPFLRLVVGVIISYYEQVKPGRIAFRAVAPRPERMHGRRVDPGGGGGAGAARGRHAAGDEA